ncbi:Protein MSP-78 [Aphelenchoides avenae]|nr:Protein MSP-78 [Aphelenchus avenae]
MDHSDQQREDVLLKVSCDVWKFGWWKVPGKALTGKDRVAILWTNTPEGAGKHFRREWLLGDSVVRRKKLPFACNL